MKTTPALLDALSAAALSVVLSSNLTREVSTHDAARRRLRAALEEKLRHYRPETGGFADGSSSSSPFDGLRNPDPWQIGLRLVELGINQAELARRLEISEAAVSKALKSGGWSFSRFQRFASALEVGVDSIVLPGGTS